MAAKNAVRSNFGTLKLVEQAMLKKLSDSLITAKDAALLKLEACTAESVAANMSKLPAHRAGFRIPYFDINGKVTKFYRFRYLEYGEAEGGFKAIVAATAKQLRYAQLGDTVNELYLPPFVKWSEYAKDPARALIITEGELKAACATKSGFATIGLGGVWCFKSAKHLMPMLPTFGEFTWTGRVVFIVYDSDAVTNPLVISAENALARELLALGAVPMIARIPMGKDGKKVGIDDYIAAHGKESFQATVLETAEEWQAAAELFKLNEEVLYVKDPGIILELESLQRMTARAFVDHAYAMRTYYEQKVVGNGTTMTEKSAAREWVKWPSRATVNRITYQPGLSRITPARELNCWRGWGCEAKSGSVKPWQDLLDYIFSTAPKSVRVWFEQWLAYPLQYPGIKLYSACVLWGIHHGTGKSMIGYTMGKIYGENFVEIGDRDLYASFNDWAERKQFVMGEEITGGDKRATADRMKSMITQKQLRVNTKFVPTYVVPDCINYYFTSNHPDAFFLEDSDRRFFVHEVAGEPLSDAFYQKYMEWLDNGGAEALFQHLLQIDTSDFNPSGHAPLTDSKTEMIENGRSDIGAWVAKLKENPDGVLRVGDKVLSYCLWSTSDLFKLYDPNEKSRVTVNGLSRELRRGGFQKAWKGASLETKTDGYQRMWIIRPLPAGCNRPAQIAELYDSERSVNGKPKSKKF